MLAMPTLLTTSEVIEALGGNAAVRALTGAKSQQRVYNWIVRGRFPAETYPAITEALHALGHRASPLLWRSVPVSVISDVAA